MRLVLVSLIFASSFFTSCSVGKIQRLNNRGFFSARSYARIIKDKDINLDSFPSILVVPNDEFTKGMVSNIKYFDKVYTIEEFELQIINDNKQDDVGALAGKIGMMNAYKKYKPYLWLRFDKNKKKKKYLQLKLINPSNFEELFVGEIYLDYAMSGVNDQNTFYPLFNSLIRYLEKVSLSFKDHRDVKFRHKKVKKE